MNSKQSTNRTAARLTGVLAGTLLCLAQTPVLAQDYDPDGISLAGTLAGPSDPTHFTPFPLLHETARAGLAFDLAGSDTRKLEIVLPEPLSLEASVESRWLNLGGSESELGASLGWLISENFTVNTSLRQAESNTPFQALGSIHCENGILEAGSYRASDCYFIDDTNRLDFGRLSIGASYAINENTSTAVNLFRSESGAHRTGIRRQGSMGGAPVLDAGLLTPVLTNPLLPQLATGQPLEYLDSDVSGIDLEFQVGVSTDRAGDLKLGLQLTRVLEGSYGSLYPDNSSLSNWNVSKPFDSARMRVDWSKGAFSGGIQSFYREPVEFLNRDKLDSITTFDVHFTWRTPWNASLSVGATNLLDAGSETAGNKDKALTDPFESVYGRIPYVRYKQDL